MSGSRRVVLLTSRFWPIVNDQTQRLLDWAIALKRHGHLVEIATPRWHKSWPQRIDCFEIPVHRLPDPPIGPLRISRYGKRVAEFLNSREGALDFVYCDSPGYEASGALSKYSSSERSRVVVRFQPKELLASPDPLKWRPSGQVLEVLRKADVLMTGSAVAHQRLLSIGLADAKILRDTSVVGAIVDRTSVARRQARAALAGINGDLYVKADDRVVVCPADLSDSSDGAALCGLADSIARWVEEYKRLHVWILGDGPERSRVYERLRYQGVHRLVAMPGLFTNMDAAFAAADLCVLPSAGGGLNWTVPTCLRSGIPLILADSVAARQTLELVTQTPVAELERSLVAAGDRVAWSDRFVDWLRDRDPWLGMAERVRKLSLSAEHHDAQARTLRDIDRRLSSQLSS